MLLSTRIFTQKGVYDLYGSYTEEATNHGTWTRTLFSRTTTSRLRVYHSAKSVKTSFLLGFKYEKSAPCIYCVLDLLYRYRMLDSFLFLEYKIFLLCVGLCLWANPYSLCINCIALLGKDPYKHKNSYTPFALEWEDSNLRNVGIKTRCLTTWRHPIKAFLRLGKLR